MNRKRCRFKCIQHKNLSSGDSMTGGPRLTDEGTGAGLHSLVNAACDKIVGTVAAHVLAVSGRGGVVGCLSPVPDGACGVGDGLGIGTESYSMEIVAKNDFLSLCRKTRKM